MTLTVDLTLKINRVPDSPKDYVCTKIGQNPLKDVDSRVFTRMLCGNNLTPWSCKSIGFQTLLRTKYVPSLVKIHWRMLILECSQGCYMVTKLPSDIDRWPMTLKINRVPDSPNDYVCTKFGKIHWRMLILECSQGCYVVKIWPGDIDLWPWKSIRFQILLRTKYGPSLVKIHWRMLILVFTRMLHGKIFIQ
jgi:hypothetical protein